MCKSRSILLRRQASLAMYSESEKIRIDDFIDEKTLSEKFYVSPCELDFTDIGIPEDYIQFLEIRT